MVPTFVTRAGWSTAAVGGALTAMGWLLGWIELVEAGLLLLTLVVSAAVWTAGGFPHSIERSVGAERIEVGRSTDVTFTVSNPGHRVAGARAAVDQVGEADVTVVLPRLAPGASSEVGYSVKPQQRGVFPVGPLMVERSDPFGLARRARTHGEQRRLVVHPRVHPVASMTLGQLRDLDGPTSDASPAGGVAFHSLRPYVPGDDLRLIHWRSTARTWRPGADNSSIMVRHLVDNRRAHLTVILDTRRSAYPDVESFELAVEIACSIAWAGVIAEHPVAAWAPGCDLGSSQAGELGLGLKDRFAEVDLVDFDEHALLGVAGLAARRSPDTSSVAFITGDPDSSAAHRLLSPFEGASTIAVVVEPERVGRRPRVDAAQSSSIRSVTVATSQEFVAAWQAMVAT